MVPLTKAENIRRWVLIALCFIATIPGGFIIHFNHKRTDEIINLKDEPNGNIGQIEERIKKIMEEVDWIEQHIYAYSEPIGVRNESPSHIDRFGESMMLSDVLKLFLDKLADMLEKHLDEKEKFDRWFKPSADGKLVPNEGTNRLLLKNIFDKIKARYEFYKAQFEQYQAEIKKANDEEKKIFEELRAFDKQFKEEVEIEVKKFLEALKNVSKVEEDNSAQLKLKHQELEKKRQEVEELIKNNRTEINKLDDEKKEVETRLRILLARKKEAEKFEKESDGYIIEADLSKNIVYVNLTKKDKLFNNMKFKVFIIDRNKIRIEKGEVELFELGDDSSKAFIVAMDPKNPIQANDQIYNEKYDKKKQARIVICGTCTKYKEEQLHGLIRANGDIVEDKVDENTTFVILGKGYEEDSKYKLAVQYNVRTYAERYLYEYLGIPVE